MLKVAAVPSFSASPSSRPHVKAEPVQELPEPSNQLLKHELMQQRNRLGPHSAERVVISPPQRSPSQHEPQLLGTMPSGAVPMQQMWQPSIVPSPMSVYPYSPVAYGATAFAFPPFAYPYSMPSPVLGFTPAAPLLASPHGSALYPGAMPMVSLSPTAAMTPPYALSPLTSFAMSPHALPQAVSAGIPRRPSLSLPPSAERLSNKRPATATEVAQESVPIRPVKTRLSPSSREPLPEEALDPEMPIPRKGSSPSEVEAAEALSYLPIPRTTITVSPEAGKTSPIHPVPIAIPSPIRPTAVRPLAPSVQSSASSLASLSPSSYSTSSSVSIGSPVRRVCVVPDCGASFNDAKDMHNHERVCVRVSARRKEAASLRTDDNVGQPLKCSVPECTFSFESPADLLNHEKQFHDPLKLYVCKHCNRRFGEQTALRRHVRTHTGERPFVCKFKCGRTFSDATNAKRHEIIHTGTKPFICLQPGCFRQFARRGSLKNHMVSLHYLHPRSLEVRQALNEGSKKCREIAEKLSKVRSPSLAPLSEIASKSEVGNGRTKLWDVQDESGQNSEKESDATADNQSHSEEEDE